MLCDFEPPPPEVTGLLGCRTLPPQPGAPLGAGLPDVGAIIVGAASIAGGAPNEDALVRVMVVFQLDPVAGGSEML